MWQYCHRWTRSQQPSIGVERVAGSGGGVLWPFLACMEARSRGSACKWRRIEMGGMAGVGDVYGQCSDGVCVSDEEVLQCVHG